MAPTIELALDEIKDAIRLCIKTDHLEGRFPPENLPLSVVLPVTVQ